MLIGHMCEPEYTVYIPGTNSLRIDRHVNKEKKRS